MFTPISPQAAVTNYLQSGVAAGPQNAGMIGGNYNSAPNAQGIRYAQTNTGGIDDLWQAANPGPWQGTGIANTGQVDNYGNVYLPVVAGSWSGSYIDPQSGVLPGRSTGQNSQLWGGPTSDGPPSWLQQIVQAALQMSGDAQKTREQHIMDSLLTPGAGANQHDLGYVERMFGLAPGVPAGTP